MCVRSLALAGLVVLTGVSTGQAEMRVEIEGARAVVENRSGQQVRGVQLACTWRYGDGATRVTLHTLADVAPGARVPLVAPRLAAAVTAGACDPVATVTPQRLPILLTGAYY